MSRFLLPFLVLIAGCGDSGNERAVVPVAMTDEAVGHYCQMNVLEHDGPKAQVHIAGNGHPIWFVLIRDAFAFDRMPEQEAEIAAIFVSDMGAPGARWEDPGADNWIPAAEAYYVVGSDRRGGMGAPDFIPFARQEKAAAFSKRHGGSVVSYGGLSDAQVLAPVDVDLSHGPETPDGGS